MNRGIHSDFIEHAQQSLGALNVGKSRVQATDQMNTRHIPLTGYENFHQELQMYPVSRDPMMVQPTRVDNVSSSEILDLPNVNTNLPPPLLPTPGSHQNQHHQVHRWISPGIMGKILEDIRMEFYNQFNSDNHSLNGVQHNPSDPPESLLGQAAQVAIPDSGLATHSKLSWVVQPNLASQTTNDLPPPPPSSLTYNDPSGLHPTKCLTTPSEVQSQKHLKAKSMVNDQLTATSMDHSGTIDSHCSETAIAEQADPSAN